MTTSSHDRAVSWAQARGVAFAAAPSLPPSTVELVAAVGRVLAEPVRALCDVPHYASSAMDGWAVRGPGPWVLRAASNTLLGALAANEARAIVTGGLVHDSADAVLRSEAGEIVGGELRASTAPSRRQHVRPVGEEFHRGEVGLEAGTRLNPAHIAVAAACGVDELVVRSRGRVSLVLTGDEVVPRGIPAPGTVRDSFGPTLPAFVDLLGGEVVRQRRVGDDHDEVVRALSADAAASDVIISTGGTGSSSADHVRRSLAQLGACILVDGVSMRPGGPSLLARLEDGRLLIGLPGNPLAAMMGLLTLGGPLLAALAGELMPHLSRVRLAHAVEAGRAETRLIPFHRVDGRAVPSVYTGSAMLRGLADASGVLVCTSAGAEVDDELEFLRLPWA